MTRVLAEPLAELSAFLRSDPDVTALVPPLDIVTITPAAGTKRYPMIRLSWVSGSVPSRYPLYGLIGDIQVDVWASSRGVCSAIGDAVLVAICERAPVVDNPIADATPTNVWLALDPDTTPALNRWQATVSILTRRLVA